MEDFGHDSITALLHVVRFIWSNALNHRVAVLLLEREDVLKQSMPICRYSTKLRHGFVGLSM